MIVSILLKKTHQMQICKLAWTMNYTIKTHFQIFIILKSNYLKFQLRINKLFEKKIEIIIYQAVINSIESSWLVIFLNH